VEKQYIPDDLHPRVLIQAIQDNLGITKKEISQRTGISYGTLNRYTREKAPIGKPRRRSIERLKKLYDVSRSKFVRSQGASDPPGTAYDQAILESAATPSGTPAFAELSDAADGLDPAQASRLFHGLNRRPFETFLRRLAYYARDDLEHFRASNYRDRERVHETRELIGDMYLALLNELADVSFAPRPSTDPRRTGPSPGARRSAIRGSS
jgi:transcriptional regulator with XRE-family HTH domain